MESFSCAKVAGGDSDGSGVGVGIGVGGRELLAGLLASMSGLYFSGRGGIG